MVYPHEAIALFRYLGSQISGERSQGIRARLIENAAHIEKLSREGRTATSVACAFLADGKCSAYEVRPSACSGYHSLSRERCEEAWRDGAAATEGTPMLEALRYVAQAMNEGTEQALLAAGLNGERIELHTALAALIRNPALVQRWRSGRTLIKR